MSCGDLTGDGINNPTAFNNGGGAASFATITGSPSDNLALDNRFKIVEDRYEYYEIWEYRTNSTTGTITIPTQSVILPDRYANGIDAIVVELGTDNRPIDIPVYTTGGALVTVTSLDNLGNYVLSGSPDSGHIGFIYQIKIKAKYSDNVLIGSIIEAHEENDVWGSITGNIIDQDDLISALNGKQPAGTYSTDIHSNITALNAVTNTNTGDQDLSGLVTKATYDANSILYATIDDTPIALSIPEQTMLGRITAGAISALTATQIRTLLNVADGATPDQDLSGLVTKATYDANSILYATVDDTPIALSIPEQTMLGRITAGAISALTATQIRTLLNVADGATPDQDLSGLVTKATYDANTTLIATVDNTPIALSIPEQTMLGRITAGDITALSIAQIKTLLSYIRTDIAANSVVTLAPSTGTTVALDRNTYKGAIVTVPSGGTLTFTIANMAVGDSYLIKLAYAGTATINWFTTLKWINSGGTAPTYSASNGKVDTFIFFCRTANNYDVHYQLDSGAV